MQDDERATRSGNSAALLIVAALQLVVCEAQLFFHLWHKSWGQTGFDGYVTPYLLPVLTAFPLVAALTQRHRFRQWEDAGDISAWAAERVSVNAGIALIITYGLVSILVR